MNNKDAQIALLQSKLNKKQILLQEEIEKNKKWREEISSLTGNLTSALQKEI